jgi:hypothetical protein
LCILAAGCVGLLPFLLKAVGLHLLFIDGKLLRWDMDVNNDDSSGFLFVIVTVVLWKGSNFSTCLVSTLVV